MNPLVSLALDVVIIILLTVTIFSAWTLGERLKAFREARREFEAIIQRFDGATQRAEAGIKALEVASSAAGGVLQEPLDRARALRDELKLMTEAGESLARRLEAAVPGRTATDIQPPKTVSEAEVRSKAERDLLRAMEGKR